MLWGDQWVSAWRNEWEKETHNYWNTAYLGNKEFWNYLNLVSHHLVVVKFSLKISLEEAKWHCREYTLVKTRSNNIGPSMKIWYWKTARKRGYLFDSLCEESKVLNSKFEFSRHCYYFWLSLRSLQFLNI